jgi:exodeoxyribonuclease VII large subunit
LSHLDDGVREGSASRAMIEFDRSAALQQAARVAGVPLTVSQLNVITRELLERELPLLWVSGEISNFTRAASGHCYFSLKDEQAQVRCVMFRHRLASLDWTPANGARVEVRATPGLYEARGEFQLNVEFMRRAGVGMLFERFTKLKAKLEAEGLFDQQRKKPVPGFPRKVGVITSAAGAALRDVLTTLRRRMPTIGVIVYPTLVQGEGAAQQIVAAIQTAGQRGECDVLIVCRGGGSIEDLWAFNEEGVARAIAACPVPVVSGVGHETDFTIADFVADMRAPTPTGAAELVSPDGAQLSRRLARIADALSRNSWRALERRMQHMDFLARRLVHPGERIAAQRRHLAQLAARLQGVWGRAQDAREWQTAHLAHRLAAAAPRLDALRGGVVQLAQRLARVLSYRLERHEHQLARLQAHLLHLDPERVLTRGYAIVRREDGVIVRRADQLSLGEALEVKLGQGAVSAEVTRVKG